MPDYLTTQREEREFKLSLKGKNDIDWDSVRDRAKLLKSVKGHAPTIISHLSAQEIVDMHHKMPSQYKLKKESVHISIGSAKEIEMDKFLNSRQL